MPVTYIEAADDDYHRHPRKDFIARGSRVKRCDDCQMAHWTCICDKVPSLTTDCEFWLLTHHKERFKPTNTGRLILMAHQKSKGFIWHRRNPPELFLEYLAREDIQPYLIFPDDEDGYQHRVHYQIKEWCEQQKAIQGQGRTGKVAFILLDATWRQARRMFRQSEYLQDLPVLSLSPDSISEFLLRKEYSDDHLCTAEVAVNLLQLIDETQDAEQLNHFYQTFNQHYVAGRLNCTVEQIKESNS